MVISRASVALNKNQIFAHEYGDNAKDLLYVSRHGAMKPIYSATIYVAIFLFISSIFCHYGSSSMEDSVLKSFLKTMITILIIISIALVITYLTIYISKYLPEYRDWYATLPTEAVEMLKTM